MAIWKKIFLLVLTVLLIAVIWQWELIGYGWNQGKGQLYIVRNAAPIENVLSDPQFPDSLKAKIEIIQKARAFAISTLGLKNTSNYTTYYDQGGKVALWNVTASAKYALEPKTWWFPIVGEVPYKGYFIEEKARRLANELQQEGWDVRVRPVGGWSTLGWFNDPILSSMLDRSIGGLAELIIHELTHSTVFVKDEVTFNENLASFIGEQGARLFLKTTFGDSSWQLIEYLQSESDSQKFSKHILQGSHHLDSLYQTFEQDMPEEEKEKYKQSSIDRICTQLDSITFSNSRYQQAFKDNRPNNAYFMSYVTYYSIGDSLSRELANAFDGDLIRYIAHIKQQHGGK